MVAMTALARIVGLAKPKPRGPKPRRRLARNTKPIPRKTRPKARRETARAIATREADAEWAQAVKARAPQCEWCPNYTMSGSGDAHHVFGRRAYPRLRHDVDNGVHLHRTCHERAHRYPVSFRTWFAARDPERWRRLTEKAHREARLS
jgi:hypothetical protein